MMRISLALPRFGLSSAKFVVAGVTAILLSGCSDSIERFSANYNNPSDNDPVYTASVPKYVRPAPVKYKKPKALVYREEPIIESPIASAPISAPAAPRYDYVQSYKKPYKQPVMKQPEIAYAEPPAAPVYTKPKYKAPTYAAEEVIADSQTAPVKPATPAFKYKQPTAKLAPAPVAEMKAKPIVAAPQVAQAAPKLPKAGSAYTVQSGETLYSLGRKFNVSPFTIASLNGLSKDKPLSLGQTIKIPAGATAAVAQAKPKLQPAAPAEEQIADSTDQTQVDVPAIPAPTKKPTLALPKEQAAAADVPAIPAPASSDLAMRWPVRGKVISDFGKKPTGLKNEGINISVPEGTSIRAAESGVVAYAGNELKGYGNLILIRHAGGYVTAYAHAKSLNVKRGDTVKRGDIIAIAGQTGAVQSPQLHFEVRKGPAAMDPMKFLSSSTASN
jgi:murein DD-endopeptidase MepM/ murein hydrolase activator NlpD